jgi:hypothetical protein
VVPSHTTWAHPHCIQPQVKRQADALEALELGQTLSLTAARDAAERERLQARHIREQQAADSKASAAAAAADVRRRTELAQLIRKHQVRQKKRGGHARLPTTDGKCTVIVD